MFTRFNPYLLDPKISKTSYNLKHRVYLFRCCQEGAQPRVLEEKES
jgi:hypothetical protein